MSEKVQRYRNFPRDSLQAALKVAETIRDENAGAPMNRLLLAEAMKLSPDSSNFRYLLSSSLKYGLTKGTEKAEKIELTEHGRDATNQDSESRRQKALQASAARPEPFGKFYQTFDQNKIPTNLPKTLVANYGVSAEHSDEAAELIVSNGRFAGLIQSVSGKERVMLDTQFVPRPSQPEAAHEETLDFDDGISDLDTTDTRSPAPSAEQHRSKPIFVGHGKNKKPLAEVESLLQGLKIPYRVAVSEPSLGRPIPTKVKQVMEQCGSAILIFTKDELFFDQSGNEVWRPSENVVYELGAAGFAYGDRLIIFKEDGIDFPANFESIGRISFGDGETIGSKTVDLLKELVGFGLVTITPV
jgi:hypothetical protein